MRILMVHNRYQTYGGEDASTEATVQLLRDGGHDVEFLTDTNDRVEELGKLRTAARSIWSPEAKGRIGSMLAEGNFDVMHVQNYFPLFSPSIYYAAGEHGVPVVQSLRNFRAVCPEGMLFRDGQVCTDCVGKRFAWPAVANKCYRGSVAGSASIAVMSSGHSLAGTWKKRVAKYVTPSAFARDIYVRAGWNPDQIVAIPNFVYPDPGPGLGSGGYAFFAGRLAPPKGLEVLVAAWNRGGFEVPLRIAGDGPLRALVEEAAEANPYIEYLGQVSYSEVAELVGDALFSVVPTNGIETFGRVAAESLARGTPAIVADHGGLAEIVTSGETGLTFPPGDVDGLISAVNSLLGDRDRLRAMRLSSRDRFLENYTGERVLAAWEDVYRQVSAGG